MYSTTRIERVVLVVMDGLKAGTVRGLGLPTLEHLMGKGASTLSARTVQPSVTAAVMTSLFTGVPPERHGITRQGFAVPRDLRRLELLTHILSRAQLPTSLLLTRIPVRYRWLASRLGTIAGANHLALTGRTSSEIVAHAKADLMKREPGFVFMHWPDADRAGHQFGWDSPEYHREARAMDQSLDQLVQILDIHRKPGTLLIVCSDHGGGGVVRTDHDSEHPEDTTVPIILAGESVVNTYLGPAVTLLDLPATILWAFGVSVPASYAGRPLREAFLATVRAA